MLNEDIQRILNQIAEHQSTCEDEEITASMINMDEESGHWQIQNPRSITPDNAHFWSHAESQLLERIKVPASYIHRCPIDLQARNINYWLRKANNKQFLIRKKNASVRAVFSTRFKPELDDYHVLPVILSTLNEDDNPKLQPLIQGNEITRLKIRYPSLERNHDQGELTPGVEIINSEVGYSALWIRPMVYGRFAYDEYGFISKGGSHSTRFPHISQLNPDKIKEAVLRAKDAAQVGMFQIFEADHVVVQEPVREIENLISEADFLTERIGSNLKAEYEQQQSASKLKIARSILDAVKDLPIFQRYLAEAEVGKYLNLFEDIDDRLASIVQMS